MHVRDCRAETTIRTYAGGSMLGTFRLGDRLTIEPVSFADVFLGDVIAFPDPIGDDRTGVLVHRVVAILPRGLITRGDNNVRVDTSIVTAENLLGKVTSYERNGVRSKVVGGRLGLLRARLLHARIHIRNLLICIGRGPYGALRRSGLVARWWRPQVTQLRVVSERGALIKYVCGGRVVARWWQQQNRFECDKPYDLVIPRPDEK